MHNLPHMPNAYTSNRFKIRFLRDTDSRLYTTCSMHMLPTYHKIELYKANEPTVNRTCICEQHVKCLYCKLGSKLGFTEPITTNVDQACIWAPHATCINCLFGPRPGFTAPSQHPSQSNMYMCTKCLHANTANLTPAWAPQSQSTPKSINRQQFQTCWLLMLPTWLETTLHRTNRIQRQSDSTNAQHNTCIYS